MSELRQNPANLIWTVIASERSKRPHDFVIRQDEKQDAKGAKCPFCPGNEEMTPPEVLALGREDDRPNTPGWQVRVVPNKFPALSQDAEPLSPDSEGGVEKDRLYPHMPGIGAHEVVIESPDHDTPFGKHSQEQMVNIIRAIMLRAEELREDRRLVYFQLFKNQGRAGGASLEHVHCQIIATPFIPAVVDEELRIARDYHEDYGECVYCDILRSELAADRRVVEAQDGFVTIAPYASRFPYELWIIPRAHSDSFTDMDRSQVESLARVLRHTFRRLELAFTFLPYNLILHTSPWAIRYRAYYHWHIEVLPRLTTIAGFELGTGYYINPTAPELAASTLRNTEIDIDQER